MNCSRFESLLSDFMEGILDKPVQAAVEEHLASCPDCPDLISEVRSLRSALSDFPEATPPDELLQRVMALTTGLRQKRSFWRDMLLPTFRPFLTQRYAFATGIMFVFLALMTHMLGPGFSGLSASDLSPSSLAENGARLSSQISIRWSQLKDAHVRFFEEMGLWWDDLGGSLDYHLITGLFKNYQESVREQEEKMRQESGETTPAQDEPDQPLQDPQERLR